MSELFEMKIIVHGQVQGVGYRASVLQFIDQNYLDIFGYVKNLPNGTVKIVAQGANDDLSKLRQFCSQGSELSRVDHIEEVSTSIFKVSFNKFEINY